MATQSAQQPVTKTSVSRKKLHEVRQLKKQALAYYETANQDHLDGLTVELRLQQAKASAALAIKHNPKDADTLNLYSRICLELGQVSQARDATQQALAIHPRNGGYWYSLGHIALTEQRLDDAEAAFRKAIKYAAKETRAESFLAYTLQAKGDVVGAFQIYRELAKTQSNDAHVRSKLFECAVGLTADYYDAELEHDVLTYLDWENTNPHQLSSLACSLLEHKFEFNDQGCAATSDEITRDPLFLKALEKTLIKSGSLERLIMALRYELLLSATHQGQVPNDCIAIASAIAHYGYNSEFILPLTDAEKNMTKALVQLIDSALQAPTCTPSDISGALLLLSMYSPWHVLKQAQTLFDFAEDQWPDYFATLRAYHQMLAKLRSIEFNQLSGTASDVSERVQLQYQEYPYPRWENLDYKRPTHYSQALQQEYPGVRFPKFLSQGPIQVLIAGCGTGRHALHVAKYFRNVQVSAIDLSATSLAYAKMKAEAFEVDNIRFYQGDLLNLPVDTHAQLGAQHGFHIIECSGVLHHIKHYHQALENLLAQLAPNGLIKIALYSDRARKPVKNIRNLFKRDNQALDKNRIKMIRQAILTSEELADKNQLVESDDFYSMSGTVDLLFHEYETQFTPLKLRKLCDQHGLQFLGFSSLSNEVKKAFIEHQGDDADFTNLEQWEAFEIDHPTTFSRMYQFYCQKLSA